MDVQQDNPFQTPQADLQQASASTLPLYRIAAVGLGTFLGTPLAGAWMLAHNLQLLGKQRDKCRESSARMGRVLSNAVARQQLPATLHIARAVNWLHSQLTGVIMFWLLDPESMDLGRDAEGFVETCLFSLANAPYLHASRQVSSA